ncbi:MAG TPA: S8 family serine peptidase [Steroidobacteraceae bacterium]
MHSFKTGVLARVATTLSLALVNVAGAATQDVNAGSRMIGINVALKQDVTPRILADIARFGKVRDVIRPIDALTLQARASSLVAIRALPYVAAANPDAVRNGSPVDGVAVEDFAQGISTWDLDAINVTDLNRGRVLSQTGAGVYVAVLDTGLLDSWRQYFPQQRIAEEYARAFGGGGGEVGNVSSQPNKWMHDQNSHGTHVTSTVLGYSLRGTPVNGVAPHATVIPVKVLGQQGWGWSSVIARGIVYVADLKTGPLANAPVVINMSLGGSVLDAVEKAAIDYAIGKGVVIVASAGNEGEEGMGYPGAYAPVVSVAAAGWVREWATDSTWWRTLDFPNPTQAEDLYITDFSSREQDGQDLDVAAPGSWVVGPYQLNSGKTSYFFLGGTSMAAPHVAGIAALMLQKNASLQQADVESILESTAIPLSAGSRSITDIDGSTVEVSWGDDASGSGFATANAALNATPSP